MKTLLTYAHPSKRFDYEHAILVKIQIDNLLSLGWKPEDIVLATNFPYEYNGVKSIVIDEDVYCAHYFAVTKINIIKYLFDKGLIEDDLYWFHDFDCHQFNKLGKINIEKNQLGLVEYFRKDRLCSASLFLGKDTHDIFNRAAEVADELKCTGERALGEIREEFKGRVVTMDNTYAFRRIMYRLKRSLETIELPIRCAHFKMGRMELDFYFNKQNVLGIQLAPDRLVEIFKSHGIV